MSGESDPKKVVDLMSVRRRPRWPEVLRFTLGPTVPPELALQFRVHVKTSYDMRAEALEFIDYLRDHGLPVTEEAKRLYEEYSQDAPPRPTYPLPCIAP